MTWVAVAIAGSAIIGAVSSSRASSAAEKTQRKGIAATNALLGPFSDAGAAGLPAVQEFVSEGADFSKTQAFKDIINTQKARGASLSGGTLTSLADFFATNFRPQRLNELLALPTIGANASAQQATNLGSQFTNLGGIKAAGVMGVGNAAQTGLNSLAFLQLTNPTGGFSNLSGI